MPSLNTPTVVRSGVSVAVGRDVRVGIGVAVGGIFSEPFKEMSPLALFLPPTSMGVV
jgi:hypothetical protein